MFATTQACVVLGAEAHPVTVEASVERGLPAMTIIGMRSDDAREARERIMCGLRAIDVDVRLVRITVGVAPADLPKSGAALDLPIAIAVLAALGVVPVEPIRSLSSFGEVGLDGGLRSSAGSLAAAGCADEHGRSALIMPQDAAEKAAVCTTPVYAANSLHEVRDHLTGKAPLEVTAHRRSPSCRQSQSDLGDVRGQAMAVEAAVTAAAGHHNLLLFGTPGSGKTMLAARIPMILPPLAESEQIEVARIHDAAGLGDAACSASRPMRAPHHTVSTQALIGGGSRQPVLGEVTLAHRGVLFLDELPEFRPSAIDALREPIQEREVRIRRASWMVRFPCTALVVAAMNLCRCGRLGATSGAACSCSPVSIDAYRNRVSGAIIDRFDVRARLNSPDGSILDRPPTMTTAQASTLIARAWDIQFARWGPGMLNGLIDDTNDPRFRLSTAARSLIDRAAIKDGFGGRTQRSIVRVARTIADLDEVDQIDEPIATEALAYCTSPIREVSHA